MNYGTIQRAYPRVRVLRGYNPNEPHTLTRSLPVATGVTILSGQFISPQWNSTTGEYQWVKGRDAATTEGFIALKDSTDTDVQSAGTLPALSCAGQFEIQTPFFKTGDTYKSGVYLTEDGATGNLKATTLAAAAHIYGIVTRINGVVDIGYGAGGLQEESGVTPDANGKVNVLIFTTHFQPYRVS
jgi:hypothetical protein